MFFIFLVSKLIDLTNRDTLSLRLETRNVATLVSRSKWVQSRELDVVNGSLCNNVQICPGLNSNEVYIPYDKLSITKCPHC